MVTGNTGTGSLDEGFNAPKAEDAEASEGFFSKLMKGVSKAVD